MLKYQNRVAFYSNLRKYYEAGIIRFEHKGHYA